MSRRGMLGCAAIGGVWMEIAVRAEEPLTPARNAVDHLLFGAPDLDRAVAWVERLTGVKAATGGSHPGVGTRNALLSLGGRQYLEIIAPDPAQTAFNFQFDVRALAAPRLIGWAARSTDVSALGKRASEGGLQIYGPRDGSRIRPDGKTLKWKTLGVLSAAGMSTVIPFFIEWGAETVHPAADSPLGCELQSFEIEHPDSAAVMELLRNVGIGAEVKRAKDAGLVSVLSTPKGRVELR